MAPWLEIEQYDTATRDAIDELWTEVEKKDMWYVMGASVGEYTILVATGDEWEMAHDDGTPKTITKDELIFMLNEKASDVKWTATEGTRDRLAIESDIGTRANNIRRRQGSDSRTARVRVATRATFTGHLQGNPNDIGFRRTIVRSSR
jgi:hypothetical protein